jgi:hypothetical protein
MVTARLRRVLQVEERREELRLRAEARKQARHQLLEDLGVLEGKTAAAYHVEEIVPAVGVS